MPAAPILDNDHARLATLQRFEIMDTPPEPAFDELAEAAARVCEVPTGLVSLVDETRQWFKARYGFTTQETDRALAFCGYTIAQREILEVQDAESDPRFADNVLVHGDPHIRFYAGAPIVTSDGFALGSLAVLDYKPNKLTAGQRAALTTLANQVVAQLELRRHLAHLNAQSVRNMERFELAARATQDIIWDWDLRTDAVWWSDAMRNYGHDPRTLSPGSDSWLHLVHPDDRHAVEDSIRHEIARGGHYWSADYRFRRADGSYARVFDRGYVAYDADGKPLRMIGAMADMTERLQLEEQLVRSQKMEAIGQLSSGLAHDFNNLLSIIQCNAHLLKDAVTGEHVASAQDILYATERAAGLTRQLLLMGRKQRLREASVDLNALVTGMTQILQRTLTARITLSSKLDPALPSIRADASMLEQVLLNLVINARDAMERGGEIVIATTHVTFDAPTRKHELTIPAGTYACLSVRDTGSGIDPAALPKIFEPFFTTKEIGRGTGLGLSTAYHIVKQHGGWLDVSSELGRGSTFVVAFPAVSTPVREPVRFSADERPRGSETLLVVEDEPLLRKRIVRMLRQHGYQVVEAESGQAALDVWRDHREHVDLVLTDLVMPGGVDGRDLIERLREDRRDLRVIYTSGFSPETAGRGERLVDGVNFLEKPYAPSALLQLIRKRLDG